MRETGVCSGWLNLMPELRLWMQGGGGREGARPSGCGGASPQPSPRLHYINFSNVSVLGRVREPGSSLVVRGRCKRMPRSWAGRSVSQGPHAAHSQARGKEHKTSHLVPADTQTGSQAYTDTVCFGTEIVPLQGCEGVETVASVTEGSKSPPGGCPSWVPKWGPVGVRCLQTPPGPTRAPAPGLGGQRGRP